MNRQFPPEPPASGYPDTDRPERRPRRLVVWLSVAVAVLAVVAVTASVLLIVDRDDRVTARYEAAEFVPDHPFTASVAEDSADLRPVEVAQGQDSAAASYRTSSSCDKNQLKSLLEAKPGAARAWAQIMRIDVAQIGETIDSMTSATLIAPLQVTNHDYESGEPRELQSVLAAGTAVLVDQQGVPRVRCACGNPLKPAKAKATDVTGAPPGFELPRVDTEAVAPTPAPPGTDCGLIQLTDGRWARVQVADGQVTCENAIGVGYDYTESPGVTLPETITCRASGDRASACRSSDGTIEISEADGPPAPAVTTSSSQRPEDSNPATALKSLRLEKAYMFEGTGSGYRGTLFDNSDKSVRCVLKGYAGTRPQLFAVCLAPSADYSGVPSTRYAMLPANSIGWSGYESMPYGPFTGPPTAALFQGDAFSAPSGRLEPGTKIEMTMNTSTEHIECGNVKDAIICVVDGRHGFRVSAEKAESW